jgi:hypothetical protein
MEDKIMKKQESCKKYGRAITDYVLGLPEGSPKGEETDVPKEELMTHLKQCAKCHKELTNWQDFQDALRVKEYHNRPEVKEKWDRFFNELTSPASACGEISAGRSFRSDICLDGAIDLNLDEKVGEPAGILWQAIGQNEPVNIAELPQVSKLEPAKAFSSFGWLAREKKVVLKKNHQGTYVCLTPAEKEKYRQAQTQG